jgi:hypothetical protein
MMQKSSAESNSAGALSRVEIQDRTQKQSKGIKRNTV